MVDFRPLAEPLLSLGWTRELLLSQGDEIITNVSISNNVIALESFRLKETLSNFYISKFLIKFFPQFTERQMRQKDTTLLKKGKSFKNKKKSFGT